MIAYYSDPEIRWYDAGSGADGGVVGGAITESGYYYLAHCGRSECCRPEGPFTDPEQARAHSLEITVPSIK
jgi:hypothetical protein